MVYMGSKRRYCKYIVPIIQNYINTNNITIFIDCFCGGANLADKIECDTIIANDLSPSLIALHQTAQQNFDLIPQDGSREYWDKAYAEWKEMKKNLDNITETENMPLYMIGAIEWYSSFANGGFPRGYAKPTATRNYYQEAYRNHKNLPLLLWQESCPQINQTLFFLAKMGSSSEAFQLESWPQVPYLYLQRLVLFPPPHSRCNTSIEDQA